MRVSDIKVCINLNPLIVRNKYIAGSELEKQDIIQAYLDGNGQIKYILRNVPFLTLAEESRVTILIKGEYIDCL